MPRTSLEIRFASRLARLRAPGAALVGVSGGADSVALLRLLVSGASPWPQLAVAHVNHGWRGAEADGDEAFVRALAAELALPFLARRVRTVDRREAAARQERLVAWREMARACGATTIVLAHTRDDQIETVALRLLRGSGVRGLRALLPVRQLPVAGGRGLLVARPLLATRRSELRAYLARLGQPFREDASNQDLRYARNALRHGVLPCWRERHAGLDHELLAIAAAADRVCRRSLRAAAAWRADVPPLWNGAAFRAAGDARFLLIAIQELAQRWRLPLERAACERLARWLARPHGAITLRGTLCGERRSELLLVGKPRVMQLASDLPVPGQAGEQPWPGRFTASAIAGSGTIGQGLAEAVRARTTAIVDADRLAGLLRCRVPLPGERVRLLGAAGSRPLRKILADRRVAPDVRTCWPVVADPQGAVWIAGVGIADRCRISDATERAVLLRWAPPRSVATVLVGGLG